MLWIFQNLRFLLFASAMEFVTADDQCRNNVYIEGMALRCSVFKRWSVAAPHLCDVKCGQEITCQSYNYNQKYQICELNNRTKEQCIHRRDGSQVFGLQKMVSSGSSPLRCQMRTRDHMPKL